MYFLPIHKVDVSIAKKKQKIDLGKCQTLTLNLIAFPKRPLILVGIYNQQFQGTDLF